MHENHRKEVRKVTISLATITTQVSKKNNRTHKLTFAMIALEKNAPTIIRMNISIEDTQTNMPTFNHTQDAIK